MTNQNELAQQLIDIALKMQERPEQKQHRTATCSKKTFRRRIEQLWLRKYKYSAYSR